MTAERDALAELVEARDEWEEKSQFDWNCVWGPRMTAAWAAARAVLAVQPAGPSDNSADPDRVCKNGGAHEWIRGADAKNERVYICGKCRCWRLGEPPATDANMLERDSPAMAKRSARIATLEATVERQEREIAELGVMLREELGREADEQRERADTAEAERDALQIRYDKLKRVQDATIAEFEQAVGSLPEAKQLRAERDALRECVRAADAVRADYGSAMYAEGYKWQSPTMLAYDAARAKVGK